MNHQTSVRVLVSVHESEGSDEGVQGWLGVTNERIKATMNKCYEYSDEQLMSESGPYCT